MFILFPLRPLRVNYSLPSQFAIPQRDESALAQKKEEPQRIFISSSYKVTGGCSDAPVGTDSVRHFVSAELSANMGELKAIFERNHCQAWYTALPEQLPPTWHAPFACRERSACDPVAQ